MISPPMKCRFSLCLAIGCLGWTAPSLATPPSHDVSTGDASARGASSHASAAPGASPAASPAASPEEVVARARGLFRDGVVAFREGRLHEARAALRGSLELRPAYDAAGQLGQVELELGDYRSAAEHIEYCLRNFPTGGKQDLRRDLRLALAAAKQHVGTVRVVVDRAGVELALGGRPVGTSPLDRELFVAPGEHTLQARTEDGALLEEKFTIEAGASRQLELTTEPPLAAPTPPALQVTTSAGGATRGVDASVEPPSWVPAYVAGGLSAAALVTSVVLRASRRGDARDIERLGESLPEGSCASGHGRPSECAGLARAIDRYDTKGGAADVTLAIGGVAAAAAIGYVVYLLFDEPASPSRVRASAGFDGAGGGVFLMGNF